MTPTSPSRRERPAKAALSRDGIVETALVILREEGLSKVTMRRIAAALDTGPASLYVYVRNTEDLHAQILDELLGSVGAPGSEGAWRVRLTDLLTRYALVLFEHPEIARMTMATRPSGPHYLSLVDALLGLLGEAGVADRDAAWAVDLLLAFATATAVEQGIKVHDDDFSALAVEVATADLTAYPHIARIGEELLSGPGPDRFTWGLDALINGVLATPRTPSTKE